MDGEFDYAESIGTTIIKSEIDGKRSELLEIFNESLIELKQSIQLKSFRSIDFNILLVEQETIVVKLLVSC